MFLLTALLIHNLDMPDCEFDVLWLERFGPNVKLFSGVQLGPKTWRKLLESF